MIRAVIYARYSAESKQTDQSIEGQVADCTAYAERNGMTVTKVYADRHISGKTDNRPEFQKMINDSDKGLFDAAIVWKIDRFGRNRYDIAVYKRKLKRNNVSLHYAAETVPEGAEGIILESVLEGLAEYYSAELRQKIERGIRENVKKGKWGHPVPYGYYKDADKRVHIDKDQAVHVRMAYQMILDGKEIKEVMELLNITKSSAHRLLRNRHYAYGFEAQGIHLDVPTILSIDTFEAVQSRLKKHTGKSNEKAKNYLLSNKVYCTCGSLCIGASGTGRSGKMYSYYTCKNKHVKVRKEWLDQEVLKHTIEDMLNDEMIAKLTDLIMDEQQDNANSKEIELVKSEIDSVNKKITNLISVIENTGNSRMVTRLDALDTQLESLQARLDMLTAKSPIIPREIILAWFDKLKHGDYEDGEYQKELIRTFVDKVIIDKEKGCCVIHYATATSPSQCSHKVSKVDITKLTANISYCNGVVTLTFDL